MERQSPPSSKRKNELTPRARALRLLARREHTRCELERKLASHVEDSSELQALLDDFTSRGWLSDERAVAQLVQAKRGRFGAARIRQELAERGVTGELMASALAGLKATELDAADAIRTRKFRGPPLTPEERARQVRFLQSRGFSIEVAMRVVRNAASERDLDV